MTKSAGGSSSSYESCQDGAKRLGLSVTGFGEDGTVLSVGLAGNNKRRRRPEESVERRIGEIRGDERFTGEAGLFW